MIGTVFEILPCARFLAMNLKDQPNTLYISVILKMLTTHLRRKGCYIIIKVCVKYTFL